MFSLARLRSKTPKNLNTSGSFQKIKCAANTVDINVPAMYDLHSTPVIPTLSQSMKFKISKGIVGGIMRRFGGLEHVQPRGNIRQAWINQDDPLAVSVVGRKAKTSRQGEYLQVEVLDEIDSNLEKAAMRSNNCHFCRIRDTIANRDQTPVMMNKYTTGDELSDESEDEGENDDEISMELKFYDQGPVFLANLKSLEPSPPRGITRQRSVFRTEAASGPASMGKPRFSQFRAPDVSELYGDDLTEEEGLEHEEQMVLSPDITPEPLQEAIYEETPSSMHLLKPGQRLSTIYVKPANACFDLTRESDLDD